MIPVLVFLGFLAVVGCTLIEVDDRHKRGRAHNKTLTEENTALRNLLGEVAAEAQVQLAAGVPEFDYLTRLITESGLLTPSKEKHA